MVRFKAVFPAGQKFFILISIPIWFDLKGSSTSNAPGCNVISIPIWFDLKPSVSSTSFCTVYISIPIWFDLKTEPLPQSFPNSLISIPIWFDLKTPFRFSARWPYCHFNSYMVRFKDLPFRVTVNESEFQFLYGSI